MSDRAYYADIRRDVAAETCPLIDRIIKAIKTACHDIELSECDEASSIISELDYVDTLEDIRRHNRALRDALVESMKTVEQLEAKVSKLTETVVDLNGEIKWRDRLIEELQCED